MVELLTVIAVIAILVAILLPGVQQSREAARRTQCANKLRQLSLALRTYESDHRVLPPGCVGTTSPVDLDPAEPHFGWLVMVLPQLDNAPLFDRFDFGTTAYDNAAGWMLTGYQTDPGDVLLCASAWNSYENKQTNYVGLHNDTFGPISADDNGLLHLNSSHRTDRVPDGASSTLILAETFVPAPVNWAFGTRASLRSPDFRPREVPFSRGGGYDVEVPDPLDVGPGLEGVSVSYPADFDTFEDALRVDSVGSFHSRGFNAATAGGEVRMISEGVGQDLLRSLVNREDGRPLGGF